MRQLRLAVPVLSAVLVVPETRCQQLVADLNTATIGQPLSSAPSGLLALPGFAAFRARTPDSGVEPWATDGTAAGTFRLRDLVPGNASSNPTLLGEYQGELLFSATLPGGSSELFLSDGTTAGTRSIGTLASLGIASAAVTYVGLANGNVLLQTSNATYETDLTAAGTRQIPGMQQFVPGVSLGSVTVGTCMASTSSFDLWATDGTVAGSRRLQVGASTQRPPFVVHNGRAFYVEVASGNNVWITSTDGIGPAARHVSCATAQVLLLPFPRLFVRGGRFVFLWPSGFAGGTRLFASDLTPVGTGFVTTPFVDPGELTEFGGALYLRGNTAAAGYELWTTDGTTVGTTLVADHLPGAAGSHPEQLYVSAHGLFFRTFDGQGRRLSRLSGPGTIQDLGPIPSDALAARNAAPWQDGLLFPATDNAGSELWFGGVTRTPARVLDINAGAPGIVAAPIAPTAAVRDRLFFLADDGTHGRELWSTDGSAAGTRVLDSRPGSTAGFASSPARSLAFFRDRIGFARISSVGLTDGTAANTSTLLANTGIAAGPVRVFGDQIYFAGSQELYRSDGTPAGTQSLPGIGFTGVADFQVLPNRIVFQSTADNIWGTDGVVYRELLVAGDARLLGAVGGRAVVDAVTGLYATDGTPAGTVQLVAQQFLRYPAVSTMGSGVAYALAADFTIWQTDGTAAGTRAVAAVPPGMTLQSLLPTDRELFALATTQATGRELWKVDRTSGLFVLVADLAPGSFSGVAAASVLGCGNLLFLAAGDEATGCELYVSDGTAAGTRLVADVSPGRASSNPQLLGIADATIYFTADDGVHGNELWSMPLGLVGAANRQEIGYGCLGSAGVPHLEAQQAPVLGAAGFGFELRAAASFAPVLLGIATDEALVPLGNCALHLGGAITSRVGMATANGSAAFGLPLPAAAGLLGLRLVAQGFVLDGLATAGFAASNGELVVVGR